MKLEITKEDSVYAFIQARINSKRLYKKVLKLLQGKPLLEWSVERAKKIHPNVNVVVITGDIDENVLIKDWCKKNDVHCFIGDENDVLNRFKKAAIEFNAKTIIRLTADNPLIDFKNALSLLAMHILEKADYSSNKSEIGSKMPQGIGIEIFSKETLSFLDSMDLSDSHREHVNDYILENIAQFNCFLLGIPEDLSNYSFTIDTQDDFDKIQNWMSNCDSERVNDSDYWKSIVKDKQNENKL